MKWFLLAIGGLWLLKVLYDRFRPRPTLPIYPIDLGFSPVRQRPPEPEVPHSHMGDDSSTPTGDGTNSPRSPDFIVLEPELLPSPSSPKLLPPPRCTFCGHIFQAANDGVCDHCGGLR